MSNSSQSDNENSPWFALRVKPNHEKRVSELISYQSIEEFLPVYRVRRRWGQRLQNIDVPLFPGYVFSRFSRQDWGRVIQTPGVVDAVRFGSTLASVDSDEIQALQMVQHSKRAVEPSPYLRPGQAIRVTAGPLAGVKGTLKEVKGHMRLVLSVTILQRAVSVEIDRNWVTYDPLPSLASVPQTHCSLV